MNMESKLGHTALTWAATCGHAAVAKVLLQAGGDIDIATSTEVRKERERRRESGREKERGGVERRWGDGWELGERERRRRKQLMHVRALNLIHKYLATLTLPF